MDLIEAGKICRDAGFNLGRGSWWIVFDSVGNRYPQCYSHDNLILFNSVDRVPFLSGATLGVIVEWAREQTGVHDLAIAPVYIPGPVVPMNGWDLLSASFGKIGRAGFDSATEIECYARLCQWVQENRK